MNEPASDLQEDGASTAAIPSPQLLRSQLRMEDLSLLLDSTRDFAAIVTNTRRKVVHWSRGAEHILGWSESEAIAFVEVDTIFTPEDRAAGVPDKEIGQALREGRAEDERWHMRKDGTRFRASGVMVPLYDDQADPEGNRALRGFGKIMRDVTERELLTSELRAKSAELSRANEILEERVTARTTALQERSDALASALSALEQAFVERQSLLQRLVSTQEDERRHLSRELHDQTGQHLAGLSLGLKRLEETITSGSPSGLETAPVLGHLKTIVDSLARDVHRIAVDLRPTALDDLGLVSALQDYLQAWTKQTGIPAELQSYDIGEEELSPEEEIALYRAVQEALTNVARHARPTASKSEPETDVSAALPLEVNVTVQRWDGYVQVAVEDTGRGFQVEETAGTGRLGLAGIRERMQLVNGKAEIESEPGQGTTVYLRVPRETRPAEEDETAAE